MQAGSHDIARRYALAFFELAKEQGQVDRIYADLQSLQRIIAESAYFRNFISNPSLRRDAQAKALSLLGEKSGFCPLTQKFLGTLAMKRRLDALPGIIAAAQDGIARHQGEVTAEVTAASALTPEQISGIASALKKALGRTARIILRQDPGILGGLIVKVGSRLVDSSVRSKLERLHRALRNPGASPDKTKMREVA